MTSDMEYFFNPRSIAIIGASADPAKLGGRPLAALRKKGFKGGIYPVNPRYTAIDGLPCFASIKDIPDRIDLAVISVPREGIVDSLRQCAAKSTGAAVIFTAGFAETGQSGRDVQQAIAAIAKESGMRVLGPNCIGFIHFKNAVMASFSDVMDLDIKHETGRSLSLITQSGSYGERTFFRAYQEGIGAGAFISVGNEADLEFSDFISYLTSDASTSVIGLYLEGAKDGGRFRRAAEAALKAGKPVLVKKVGKSGAGTRAAASHTGSLAGNDRLYDSFFRQMGIVRFDELRDLTNFTLVHGSGRIPRGRNVGILTDSGGPGVEMADRCEEFGLHVPELGEATRRRIEKVLPFYGSARNPVDMTAAVMTDQGLYNTCLRAIFEDDDIDIVFAPGFFMAYTEKGLLDDMLDIYNSSRKPLVMFPVWEDGSPQALEMISRVKKEGIPLINEAGDAAWAVSSLARYGERRQRFLDGDTSGLF